MRRFAILVLTMALAGCAAPPAPSPTSARPLAPQPVPPIAADEPGQRFAVDAARSSVRIHVFRAGRAATLGHNHVLSVPNLDGVLLLAAIGRAEGARFELSFRLDELLLDAPEMRAALGPAWASVMTAEAVAATRANMLGLGNLQAGRFPEVHLRSNRVGGEWPKLVAELEIELHGQRQRQWLPLQAEWSAGRIQASGSLVVRQSDFGITPFTVLGGLLAVRDELLIEFEVSATGLARTLPPPSSAAQPAAHQGLVQ